MLSNRLVMQQVLKIREWPPKPMPSSRCRMKWILVCLGVSARFLHGFCTVSKRAKGAETRSSKPAMHRKEMTLKRNFQKLRESPGVRYESVGRGFESLPSHQEKPEHVCVLVFLFVHTMEGLEQGGGAQRRKQSHRAALLSLRVPTARNVYRGSCNRKIYGNKEERVRLISRRFKTEKMEFHIDKTSRQVYNRTWKQQGITAKSVRMPLWIETG